MIVTHPKSCLSFSAFSADCPHRVGSSDTTSDRTGHRRAVRAALQCPQLRVSTRTQGEDGAPRDGRGPPRGSTVRRRLRFEEFFRHGESQSADGTAGSIDKRPASTATDRPLPEGRSGAAGETLGANTMWRATGRAAHASNNVAKHLPLIVGIIRRTALKTSYGRGFGNFSAGPSKSS